MEGRLHPRPAIVNNIRYVAKDYFEVRKVIGSPCIRHKGILTAQEGWLKEVTQPKVSGYEKEGKFKNIFPEDYELWLDADVRGAELLRPLLRAYLPEELSA